MFPCKLRLHILCFFTSSFLLLFAGLQAPAIHAAFNCKLRTVHSDCTALPVIHSASLYLTNSNFELHARYEACHVIRSVHITGRALLVLDQESIREYELLGETFQPVTGFVSFPRTVAYMVLDTSSGKGTFTDMWSAQRLPRHSQPAILTAPIRCGNNSKEY